MNSRTRVIQVGALLAIAGFPAAVAAQLLRPLPTPAVSIATAATLTDLATRRVPVLLPPQGSLSLRSGDGRTLASLAADAVRPIGSVAKTMTALVVLDAHPLTSSAADGPIVTMAPDDVSLYQAARAEDGSSLPVRVGERLTERQLLTALMLPSANNIAETLAVWVAGGHETFVARLNDRAARLAMTGTHFADASGYDRRTVSTAADLVTLGDAALANPTLAALVRTRHAALPDGTVLDNLDTLLASEPGWLGIKTGETPSAGGCLLFAVRRSPPGGHDAVMMVGAVLGQTDLTGAMDAARRAAGGAYLGYTEVAWSVHPPAINGSVAVPWGDTSSVTLGATHGAASSLVRPDDRVSLRVVQRPHAAPAPLPAGTVVAAVHALVNGADVASWDDATTGPINAAPAAWHIMHG